MAGEFSQRPARVTITNVDTGASVDAQMNPKELKEKLEVVYNDLEILGMSTQPQQFQYTKNLELTFDLEFSVFYTDGDRVLETRSFLHSLCYPRAGATDVIGGGPPSVLFSWPNLYALMCKIRKLDGHYTQFAVDMRPQRFSC